MPLAGEKIRSGGIAKGAGMINPDMATMLCFITTDAAISKRELQKLTSASIKQSFNCVTVDGDMSNNDTTICIANGPAAHPPLSTVPESEEQFGRARSLLKQQPAHILTHHR